MCLLYFVLIIYLINKNKDSDYMIAFLVGLTFMTKQNIGVFLLLPMIYYSKNKWKSIIFFALPIFIISNYLLLNGAFYNFIDYCFLGLFDFQENNSKFDIVLLFCEIVFVTYIGFQMKKSKFQDKELFYILMFQSMTYPILDIEHFFVAVLPVLYVLSKKFKEKYILYPLYPLYCFLLLLCLNYYPCIWGNIHTKKDLIYLKAPSDLSDFSRKIYDYFEGNIQNVYSNSEYIYLTKLYFDIPVGKYDLLISGNLGKNKNERYV